MHYLDTAFAQLEFAIKLMHAAEQGAVSLDEIDVPLTIEGGRSILVLPDKVFHNPDDFINACQNNVSITFGAAAITLNRCREEAGLSLPDPVVNEIDQWIALVYQIRNAFAHDISEPKWNLKGRYARPYEVAGVQADLSNLHEAHFDYAQIGGPDALFHLRNYACGRLF